jgi:MoaA/NifB/PqqE/SkfB family radical SAM enzyme
MFNFKELKQIHLEVTNNCQASCPMCARNQHGGPVNPLLQLNDWTLEEFKQIITQEVLDQVERIYFCGNFGDPILNQDLVAMCQHIKDNAPDVIVGIHTNGGARNTKWWESLAQALPKNHLVMFGIDGLEDTHHLHRIGTTYDNVIRNAQAFISAGGTAEWTFIKFKHNEHQAEECRKRSVEMGFARFTLKNSSRFVGEPFCEVQDKEGNHTHTIEPPTDTPLHFISKEIINSYKELVAEAVISCHAQHEKEIYIDAHKKLLPCCWVSSIPTTYYDNKFVDPSIDYAIKSQYANLVEELGQLNATRGIRTIIDSEPWQTVWNKYWNEEKMITCARVCGKFTSAEISQPSDQFLEVQDNRDDNAY